MFPNDSDAMSAVLRCVSDRLWSKRKPWASSWPKALNLACSCDLGTVAGLAPTNAGLTATP